MADGQDFTGKRVVDVLLVLIDLFAKSSGWGATSEYRFKIADFAPTGAGWSKISGRRGRPHQPFLFSEN